ERAADQRRRLEPGKRLETRLHPARSAERELVARVAAEDPRAVRRHGERLRHLAEHAGGEAAGEADEEPGSDGWDTGDACHQRASFHQRGMQNAANTRAGRKTPGRSMSQ